jgi:polyphenol oxidase
MSDILRFTSLASHPTVAHGVSTKVYDTMKKEDGTIHHANVLKFAKSAGITGVVVCMDQVHSGNVTVVENERELVIPKTDGMVTKNKNIALGVVTADCLPILMYDPVHEAIGVAHAGSKGLLKNIIGNTIKAFVKNFDTNPADLVVAVGPSIEQKCYTVGQDLIRLYKTAFAHYNSVYIEGNGTFFLDIRSVAVQDLRHEGVLKENISVSPTCTKCSPDKFYSYRAGDTMGRFISLISLR